MTHDLPVGSITGQNEWEWNRWQGESPESIADPTSRQNRGSDTEQYRSYPEEIAALRRTVREAEVELERRKQRHQYLIRHYERLLAEKNRRLMRANRSNSVTGERRPLLSLLRRVLPVT